MLQIGCKRWVNFQRSLKFNSRLHKIGLSVIAHVFHKYKKKIDELFGYYIIIYYKNIMTVLLFICININLNKLFFNELA